MYIWHFSFIKLCVDSIQYFGFSVIFDANEINKGLIYISVYSFILINP